MRYISETEYRNVFSLFETLYALIYLDTSTDTQEWMPPHLTYKTSDTWDYLLGFWEKAGKENENWGAIGAGLFNGNTYVVRETLDRYMEIAHLFQRGRTASTVGTLPNFAEAYGHDGPMGYMIHADDSPIGGF